MARMTLVVEAPEIVLSLLASGIAESDKTLIMPDTIWPGYRLNIVSTNIEENQ